MYAYAVRVVLQGRMRQEDYYESMGRSRFGIALPGLGYDTFR